MKFLVDVCIGKSIQDFLISAGYDVVDVFNINPSMADSEILEWAFREKRIVLTLDQDFERMIWIQEKKHCGVLRLSNLRSDDLLALLKETLDKCKDDLLEGAIVIANPSKIRIRRK